MPYLRFCYPPGSMSTRAAIIGTAGHIDHGKTQLIRALTGVDTDRLKEEKKRGISIELGFASLTLPSGTRCGVVDVPGHERFIRNMLAGAGGIDLILLVIAADEGVMPQTREHLDIIQLLGVHQGVVALTKVDLVDPEWLELAHSDVEDYLAKTSLAGAKIVPVSSFTGQGMDDLRAEIDRVLAGLEVRKRGRFTRLPVDRVFTMEGFGTVVTGTLWGGPLRVGDPVGLQPRGIETRIKALEVHKASVEEATPGQRVAVCLHNVPRERASRGDWLVKGDALDPVVKLDVRFEAIQELRRPVQNRMRIRFYLGASEVMGRILLLESDELNAGESCLAQIQLEAPALAERGDRFVVRSFSPMHTLGGGRVIDVSESRRRRYRAEDLDALRMAEEGTQEDRVHDVIKTRGGQGLALSELTQQLGQPPDEIQSAVDQLVDEGRLLRVGRTRLVAEEPFAEVGRALEEAILEHEKQYRLRFGPQKSELKSRLKKAAHPETVEAWIRLEIEAGRLFASGDRVRRSGPDLKLTPPMKELRAKMLTELEDAGYSGPTQRSFLFPYQSDKLAPEMLTLLLSSGDAVRLPSEILVHGRYARDLKERLQGYFASHSDMAVADLKEILGVSRKQGVPLLEYADQQQWTQRNGDVRVAGRLLNASASSDEEGDPSGDESDDASGDASGRGPGGAPDHSAG
ncbi:MAG: selenocysteine-specific translation elongation factor [Candidatus Eisenbacteria bacterium]|uniref:Selenocysteine-specific elongation factor n=1 Tax=Eiseniibacteriota bacterium TaxID=2212470 RepID=A0A956NIN6_UNCEI|nr:selenocysteine-specific translation elongation factor [Candidatus Eisenbacteria bacterium]